MKNWCDCKQYLVGTDHDCAYQRGYQAGIRDSAGDAALSGKRAAQRSPYSEECQKVIDEIEERFANENVELVSIEHHTKFVDMAERAEQRVAELEAENAAANRRFEQASETSVCRGVALDQISDGEIPHSSDDLCIENAGRYVADLERHLGAMREAAQAILGDPMRACCKPKSCMSTRPHSHPNRPRNARLNTSSRRMRSMRRTPNTAPGHR